MQKEENGEPEYLKKRLTQLDAVLPAMARELERLAAPPAAENETA